MVAFFAWLSQLAFLRSTCATKASVLLFYRRLVKGTYSKKWKYATIAAIALTVCYCVAFIFALIFNCNPTEAYWKGLSYTYTRDWRCSDTTIANPLSGALSVCSDLYAVILPMGMLYKFDIERKKRIALYAVFSLGLLVVAAGSVRTYYLARLSYDYDLTWVRKNAMPSANRINTGAVPSLTWMYRLDSILMSGRTWRYNWQSYARARQYSGSSSGSCELL